jgi:predicted transcriptional regulator
MTLEGLVKDYMIRNVFTTKPKDNVLKALKTIATGVDQLPVIDDEGKLGMVTWQDILEKVLLKGQNPKRVLVQEVMKTKITRLSPEDSIERALSYLKIRKFSLPVVKNDKLVGLLSFMDILKSYLKTSTESHK